MYKCMQVCMYMYMYMSPSTCTYMSMSPVCACHYSNNVVPTIPVHVHVPVHFHHSFLAGHMDCLLPNLFIM